MRKRIFGNTGIEVPVVGLGTWQMEIDDKKDVINSIQTAIELGATHIDTAELYGSGSVEELVGQAIAGAREKVFLVSKVIPYNASHHGTIMACERSLRRLQTNYLDCYLLHWAGNHPLEETISAFKILEEQGKIRSYGVSNFNTAELKQAYELSDKAIACNQVMYHLEARTIEHNLIPYCQQHKIALVGYSPYAQGIFPPANKTQQACLNDIAKAHKATAWQVALSYLIRDEGLFCIPKTINQSHLKDNIAAANLELTTKECAHINEAFPRGLPQSTIPMI